MNMFRVLHKWLPNMHEQILGTYLVFSVNCVHILTWGELNALCWLAENDIIIREVTDKIQHMALRGNYKTTAKKTKGEEDSRQFVTLS